MTYFTQIACNLQPLELRQDNQMTHVISDPIQTYSLDMVNMDQMGLGRSVLRLLAYTQFEAKSTSFRYQYQFSFILG